jgi:drug/metabolite transporter (DMT)-like permease
VTSKRTHYIALSGLLLVATSWGATFVLTKAVLRTLSPEWFMFYRFLLAGLVLTPLAFRKRLPDRATLRMGIILGFLVFVGYWLQTAGLQFTTPSKSAFLTGVGIVGVPLFDRLIYKTRVEISDLIGLVLAIAGLYVLFGGIHGTLTVGDVMTIGCAVAFAFHIVLTARWSEITDPAALATVQLLFVAVASVPTLLISQRTPLNDFTIGAILYFAIVNTSIAFLVLIWAQARVSATEAAIALSFEPVAAAITSVLYREDDPTVAFVAGGVLVVIGIIVSQLQPGKVDEIEN